MRFVRGCVCAGDKIARIRWIHGRTFEIRHDDDDTVADLKRRFIEENANYLGPHVQTFRLVFGKIERVDLHLLLTIDDARSWQAAREPCSLLCVQHSSRSHAEWIHEASRSRPGAYISTFAILAV